ncbi:hypothetical protein [Cryobacterium sp. GrIS_2_6]|uniref:hypothetical protein n=1 Tax=Cryobacterium sp. GrIS_2_6 TaxID=3162785 RepID=UPI002E0CAEEC|nr:hypothetical protein [Cryobacterium psychrotolerans]
MAKILGEYNKETSAGNKFIIRFYDDATLLEWSAGETPEQGWPGTWKSGTVKYTEHITTRIGNFVDYYTGELGVAVRSEVDGMEVVTSMLTMDRGQFMRLQGYPHRAY